MVDPIAKKLDEEWTYPVVREPDLETVRRWLRGRETEDIQLYLGAFGDVLDKKHPTRARLLREELERREKPTPDRVAEIIAALRRNWIVAGIIVFASAVGGLAAFKESLCDLRPSWCQPSEPVREMTLDEWFKQHNGE